MRNFIFASIVQIFIMLSVSLEAKDDCYSKLLESYTYGKYEEALNLAEKCMATDTSDYRIFFLYGKIQENLYSYDKAIDAFIRAIRINDKNAGIKSELASVYIKAGLPEKAIELYRLLSETEPEINQWKINHAATLQIAKRYRTALNVWKQIVEHDSLNWTVHREMGECYAQLNIPDSAVFEYTKAFDYSRQNKSLVVQLMKIYNRIKNYDKVIEIGEKAVLADSTNVEIWKYLGFALFTKEKFDESFESFTQAVALSDTSFTTTYHLGIIYYFKNDYDSAEKYLKTALIQDESNLTIMYYLSVVYGFLGEHEKGLKMIDEINTSLQFYDTVRIRAEIQQGYLYFLQCKYEEAIKSYQTAIKANPSNPGILYNLAFAYEKQDKKKQALEWYIRFLNKVDPQWESKKDSKKGVQKTAIERVEKLRVDLFFEDKSDSQQK